MRKIIIYLIFLVPFYAFSTEGMWLPCLLEQLNEPEMKNMGLKISAKEVFDLNNSSLKDAIVLFGRGCTGELISDEGLLLTNHHCGYSNIQYHSTLEHDYLTNGFWAMNKDEELQCPGLTVSFLIKMENVTNKVTEGTNLQMTEKQREEIISKNSKKIEKESIKDTHYESKIKSFYYGNEYYLFIYETFKDIRLVGAPPSSIGKFGGDTDNWMWPRHTGDFSMFRIYANKNNEPADYSKENIPYKPKKFFTINIKGVNKGDFTMVYGYPGNTSEYLTSYAVEMISQSENPAGIEIRDKKLRIMDDEMALNDEVRIKYAAKYATTANYWKKWIGENKGLKSTNAIEVKKNIETDFVKWINNNDESNNKYSKLLPTYESCYNQIKPYNLARKAYMEAGLGIEIVKYSYSFKNLVEKSKNKNSDEDIKKAIDNQVNGVKGFFKNYSKNIDKKMLSSMLELYSKFVDKNLLPDIFKTLESKYKNNYNKYADYVFENTIFSNENKINDFLKNYKSQNYKKIEKDPAYILAMSIYTNNSKNIEPIYDNLNKKIDSLNRVYIKALMLMQPEKRFYPDANSTMRIAYGKIDDYYPKNAVKYNWFTTLDGIMEKESPDVPDYKVPTKLKELYLKKDYGIYASNDTMKVAFIASNHTTGGNSGSPVLNAYGQLVGINFDRNWEGTMSDILYNPDLCRNITLDIRYCLFIIDKYAGASHLIKEMKIEK